MRVSLASEICLELVLSGSLLAKLVKGSDVVVPCGSLKNPHPVLLLLRLVEKHGYQTRVGAFIGTNADVAQCGPTNEELDRVQLSNFLITIFFCKVPLGITFVDTDSLKLLDEDTRSKYYGLVMDCCCYIHVKV